jgi:hypothetical protein
MLRRVTIGAGFLLLALVAFGAFAGWPMRLILFALVPALALTLGVVYERKPYRAILETVPPGNWRDTGERFVDPETRRSIAVYSDPASGKRIYIGLP